MNKLNPVYFLFIGLLGCEPAYEPTDPNAEIAANSCDADDVCEVAKTLSTRKGSTSALRLMSDAGPVIVDGPLASESLVTGRITIDGKIISTSPGTTSALVLASDVDSIIVEGRLSVPKLGGKGNAYACLDNNGLLFRSETPCK
ncbi:hypothetical protein Q9L42_003695 [Methylomarinum sp. Ch1-1]|uniref:Lipoprotein n=1 Tax=Methylomarinum roseum TaxID=3067653 RepID=A0AAU7NW64_9GAMM|nr:hypothetical protein [Methylomarinum sp. Ch1-1]MDP4522710.1 hypothetical protein [Methylomarinum sp. Ch1-1]